MIFQGGLKNMPDKITSIEQLFGTLPSDIDLNNARIEKHGKCEFQEFLDEQLGDPEFRREWYALQSEFAEVAPTDS
jgi:hypothetical protein